MICCLERMTLVPVRDYLDLHLDDDHVLEQSFRQQAAIEEMTRGTTRLQQAEVLFRNVAVATVETG